MGSLFTISFIAGFIGGSVTNAAISLIMKTKDIPNKKKEVCISISVLSFSAAIITSSFIGFIFDLIVGE
jgi:hypothetical protein